MRRSGVKTNQFVQVVTSRSGTILGVLRQPREGSPSQAEAFGKEHVQVRLTPLPGQVVTDVQLPDEIGALETAEDFQRLVAEFNLPRNAKELRRRKDSKRAPRRH